MTTAQLLHVQEEREAPPKSLKEKWRSAMEGPEPVAEPCTWVR
ncbi:hypothetical protein [Streptomyces chilikensis]|nr:hypothetical protein [Streptomyces chilikensis]